MAIFAVAEPLPDVGFAVAVRIAERDDASTAAAKDRAATSLGVDEDISVGSDHNVTRSRHTLCEHGRAKAARQVQAGATILRAGSGRKLGVGQPRRPESGGGEQAYCLFDANVLARQVPQAILTRAASPGM